MVLRHLFSGLIAGVIGFSTPTASAEPFSFVTLGDMPYGAPETAYPPYERLIKAINRAGPDFVIHVGDIKSGGTPCSDTEFDNQLAFMNQFADPVIYTPGDNEWTDCHRKKAGEMDPLERLETLREMFFATINSLGARTLPLTRQPTEQPVFQRYPENVRWTKNDVTFVTLHIVGSKDNGRDKDERAARREANLAWLKAGFDAAMGSKAMVVSIHADPFKINGKFGERDNKDPLWVVRKPFDDYMDLLIERAVHFGKPVLFIHGDSHVFRIDQPFWVRDGGWFSSIDNITRLEVFGDKDVHAVEVSVDPDSPEVFGFKPLIVQENVRNRRD